MYHLTRCLVLGHKNCISLVWTYDSSISWYVFGVVPNGALRHVEGTPEALSFSEWESTPSGDPADYYFASVSGGEPHGQGGNGIDGDDIWVGATGTYLSTVGNVGHNAWWWQDAKGAYRSTKLLQVGSNGKYVQGVQGLRNSYAMAGKAASLTKIAGNTLGAVGVGISVYDMTQNGINVSNSMDAIMGATAFIPVVGWVSSGTYFSASFITELSTGKSISKHAQGWVNTW